MGVNLDKPHLWKRDVANSVDLYNEWFLSFAPETFRATRILTTQAVESALAQTANLTNITPALLRANPGVLPTLRAGTAPPIARDRLIGLAGVTKNLVESMEGSKRDALGNKQKPRIPPGLARKGDATVDAELSKIGEVIEKLADFGVFPWLESGATPNPAEVHRAATIVADRLCGSQADPIIRNAQEQRQIDRIEEWLIARRYSRAGPGITVATMQPGTYTFWLNVPITQRRGTRPIKIPVDAVIMPHEAMAGDLPLLIEAKSAGDFANPNKRRKEEATKRSQLIHSYGPTVRYILFLRGYFDTAYLGYEAAEGIDWVWEHRIDDLAQFGV